MNAVLKQVEHAAERKTCAYLPYDFDWRKPDYSAVIKHRAAFLTRIVVTGSAPSLFGFYSENPIQFIIDWGVTFDPRNIARGMPSMIPFVPFPRQIDWCEWVLERWKSGERGLSDKSRGSGVSWLAVSLGCTLSNFRRGFTAGYGSRKKEYVDHSGDPKCLFWKARVFMENVPQIFTYGWDRNKHALDMRILYPHTGSAQTGECGDGIGRGDRTSIYFVDEAAFLEHPEDAESSLSDTTDCRIDISTPNGPANAFAERRQALPPRQVFSFHWRDDPRRDEKWYAKKKLELPRTIIAREYDINYAASIDFVVIPAEWIAASVDAHLKLGLSPSGTKRGGLDVADQGIDLNAFVSRHGCVLNYAKAWTGQGSDIYETVVRAFGICDTTGCTGFAYDADGVGAGVRGDARTINETRRDAGLRTVADEPFQGSGSVYDPDGEMVAERINKEFFLNLKAQCWWNLRILFQNTHRAVVEDKPFKEDEIISISSSVEDYTQLIMELSQPIYRLNALGKVQIEKSPEGAKSPNLADATMICFSPIGLLAEMWARLGEGE
jgi:hypothetical protein